MKWKVAACAMLLAGTMQAAPLWDNGVGYTVVGSGSTTQPTTANMCDSSIGCFGGAWTVFDNFTVSSRGWVVSGFDFTDFFIQSTPAAYKSTNWSIWQGDPLAGGTLVAFGTASASLSSPDITCGGSVSNCRVNFSISLGNAIGLSSGTYYLGLSNTLSGTSGHTDRAVGVGGANNGMLLGWENSAYNGASPYTVGQTWSPTGPGYPNNTITTSDSSFDIQGTLAPEPATWAMMGLAIAGLGWLRRRKA